MTYQNTLADDFKAIEADKLNMKLKAVKAPFFQVCSSRKKNSKKQITWRRYNDSCLTVGNFTNAYWVSKDMVNKWLKKNKNTGLTALGKNGKAKGRKKEKPDTVKSEKLKVKSKKTTKIPVQYLSKQKRKAVSVPKLRSTESQKASRNKPKVESKPKAGSAPKTGGKKQKPEDFILYKDCLDFSKEEETIATNLAKKYFKVGKKYLYKSKQLTNKYNKADGVIITIDSFYNNKILVLFSEEDRKTIGHNSGEIVIPCAFKHLSNEPEAQKYERRKQKAESKKPKVESKPKPAKIKKAVSVPKPRSSGKFIFGDEAIVQTPSKTINAKFAVTELKNIIPSNDPFSFSWNEKYPKSCQTRDYKGDDANQAKVKSIEQKFDARHLINDSPDATTGTPIIIKSGPVLGGNGRTMAMKRIARFGNYKKLYIEPLLKKASNFGLKQSDIENFSQPVLVRVIDANLDRCSYYSNILNEGMAQKEDPITEGIAYSKNLSAADYQKLAAVFDNEDVETLIQALNTKKYRDYIEGILKKAGIITQQNFSAWIDRDTFDFTDSGKKKLETILLGGILPNRNLIVKAKSIKNKLLPSVPELIQIKSLPKRWNLLPSIHQVIQNEHGRMKKGITTIDKYVMQTSAFDEPVSKRTELLWKAISGQGQKVLKKYFQSYLKTAKNESSGSSMFGGSPATPEEVLGKFSKSRGLADGPIKWNNNDTADNIISRHWHFFVPKSNEIRDEIKLRKYNIKSNFKELKAYVKRLYNKLNALVKSGKNNIDRELVADDISFYLEKYIKLNEILKYLKKHPKQIKSEPSRKSKEQYSFGFADKNISNKLSGKMKKFRKYSTWSEKLNGFINVIADSKPKALKMAKEKDSSITNGMLKFQNDSMKHENKCWVVGKSKYRQKRDREGTQKKYKADKSLSDNFDGTGPNGEGPGTGRGRGGCSDCGTLDDNIVEKSAVPAVVGVLLLLGIGLYLFKDKSKNN